MTGWPAWALVPFFCVVYAVSAFLLTFLVLLILGLFGLDPESRKRKWDEEHRA